MKRVLDDIKTAQEFREIIKQHNLKYLEKFLNKIYLEPIKLIKYIVPLEKINESDEAIYVLGWLKKEEYNIIISFNGNKKFNIDDSLDFILKYRVKENDLAKSHNWLYFNIVKDDILPSKKIDSNKIKQIRKLKKLGFSEQEIARKLQLKEFIVTAIIRADYESDERS